MHTDALERTEREVAELCRGGLDKDAFCRSVGKCLAGVVRFDGSCWHTIDPMTLLITSHLTENIPEVNFPLLAWNEYVADDVNRFASLANGRRHVATLHGALAGKPERSLRHREMLAPRGLDAELRASFVSRSSCWGSLILVREAGRPDFAREERELLSRLSSRIAEGLRRALLMSAARESAGEAGPGLLILGCDGSLESLTPAAAVWLDELSQIGSTSGTSPLPPVVLAVAAAALDARTTAEPVRTHVRTSAGRWLALDAARLLGGAAGQVSVVIAPAQPAETAAFVLRAYGLSARESEVARLVLLGRSTPQVSAALFVSPNTVQDHLKSIFDKVGVRSRKELVGHIFFEHYLPKVNEDARPGPSGFFDPASQAASRSE
jgi:DNA-binding CsgD family transcriptional regulator